MKLKIDGRKKIFLIAYTGHGCQFTPQAYTHAITDDNEEGSVFNIERKIIEIGQRRETSVFGVLSCCRNDPPATLTDGANIANNTFKGAIVFGARKGDTQSSESTLALQLREHLNLVLEHKGSNMIELPTDLISQDTHWNINKGQGQIHPGYPFRIRYLPENENEKSYRIMQDNHVEEDMKEEWPPSTYYFVEYYPEPSIAK